MLIIAPKYERLRAWIVHLLPFEVDDLEDSSHYGELYADVPTILDDTLELYCLHLARLENGRDDAGPFGVDYSMVVTPLAHDNCKYRRVGLYQENFRRDRRYQMFPAHIPYSNIEII